MSEAILSEYTGDVTGCDYVKRGHGRRKSFNCGHIHIRNKSFLASGGSLSDKAFAMQSRIIRQGLILRNGELHVKRLPTAYRLGYVIIRGDSTKIEKNNRKSFGGATPPTSIKFVLTSTGDKSTVAKVETPEPRKTRRPAKWVERKVDTKAVAPHGREALEDVHTEVFEEFYGRGVTPASIEVTEERQGYCSVLVKIGEAAQRWSACFYPAGGEWKLGKVN